MADVCGEVRKASRLSMQFPASFVKGVHIGRPAHLIPVQERTVYEMSAIMPDFVPLPGGRSRVLKHRNPYGGSCQCFFAVFVKISCRQISGQSALKRSGRRVGACVPLRSPPGPSCSSPALLNIMYIYIRKAWGSWSAADSNGMSVVQG